jgi:hypothetical protein
VFGYGADDITKQTDKEIYNDFDFYQILLKDFLTSNEGAMDQQREEEDQNGERDIYLEGADLGMT